jgi:hypothetical protein
MCSIRPFCSPSASISAGGLHELEQRSGGLVHADIGGLCREHDGDQELVDIVVFQFRLGLGHRLPEACKELGDDGGLHQGHISFIP